MTLINRMVGTNLDSTHLKKIHTLRSPTIIVITIFLTLKTSEPLLKLMLFLLWLFCVRLHGTNGAQRVEPQASLPHIISSQPATFSFEPGVFG